MGTNYYEKRNIYSDEVLVTYYKTYGTQTIKPLSKGGTHTWNNVQLAHMACNAGKCDKMNGGKI